MAPFDRPYATFYWSAIANKAPSCTIFEFFDVEIGVRGHSMSLKVVPFKSLGKVSYSPSIVTMAISCIVCEQSRLIGRKLRFFLYPTCI